MSWPLKKWMSRWFMNQFIVIQRVSAVNSIECLLSFCCRSWDWVLTSISPIRWGFAKIAMQSSNASTPTRFDNNNDIYKKSLDKMSDSSKSSYHAIKSTESLNHHTARRSKKSTCFHLNNLWSIWYGVFCTALQGYAGYKCLKRILGMLLLLQVKYFVLSL